MKRFIDIYIPVRKCNLNCHYCYIAHEHNRDTEVTRYKYSIDIIKMGLSKERMGGACHFNLCGMGETLLPKEIIEITRVLLELGHYVMIVTNGLATNRFREFSEFPEDLKRRLGFKFSFHYLELLNRELLDKFFKNIDFVRSEGMSFSLEMTPSDELEPYIDDIKNICISRVGAYCHVTIPRDMTKEDIVLLSEHSFEDFYEIWKTFDSEMFEFKSKLWENKRNEFCYAGLWSGLLDISTGLLSQCYGSCMKQNIFENTDKPINWLPIGHNCSLPHCYNSHSLLGLGCIPELAGNYALERDRIDFKNNQHWLNKDMYDFLARGMIEDNEVYTKKEQKQIDFKMKRYVLPGRLKSAVKFIIKR